MQNDDFMIPEDDKKKTQKRVVHQPHMNSGTHSTKGFLFKRIIFDKFNVFIPLYRLCHDKREAELNN